MSLNAMIAGPRENFGEATIKTVSIAKVNGWNFMIDDYGSDGLVVAGVVVAGVLAEAQPASTSTARAPAQMRS